MSDKTKVNGELYIYWVVVANNHCVHLLKVMEVLTGPVTFPILLR